MKCEVNFTPHWRALYHADHATSWSWSQVNRKIRCVHSCDIKCASHKVFLFAESEITNPFTCNFSCWTPTSELLRGHFWVAFFTFRFLAVYVIRYLYRTMCHVQTCFWRSNIRVFGDCSTTWAFVCCFPFACTGRKTWGCSLSCQVRVHFFPKISSKRRNVILKIEVPLSSVFLDNFFLLSKKICFQLLVIDRAKQVSADRPWGDNVWSFSPTRWRRSYSLCKSHCLKISIDRMLNLSRSICVTAINRND